MFYIDLIFLLEELKVQNKSKKDWKQLNLS